ncbi:MAG: hypothetical protein K9J16_10385 [Melioribacteraceae bacterium]|nr:hypothetical protein [Melioribacteraceae bacterium]MCF8354965.1 hypothetical protein [Melioribacteraceae bacterium]MCF8394018.1 hypothetical protein [Melioribacteraceae bacterium]MCF8419779.1 hypothetical protein [Melioribacteraceae bacterium]
MTKKERLIMTIASMILIGTFFFPIWKIDLQAPQYPEGIGLRIWVNKITGASKHDLDNINKLNHYIGMKEIKPESIPELSVMPFIIGFFIVTGLIAAFLKKKPLASGWLALFIITLIYGFYDYYLWGYDYGHNLNPNAPIKIPGMVYQPPLFGSKQLLNMLSVSLPGTGSFLIGVSIMLVLYVLFNNKFKRFQLR